MTTFLTLLSLDRPSIPRPHLQDPVHVQGRRDHRPARQQRHRLRNRGGQNLARQRLARRGRQEDQVQGLQGHDERQG